MLEQLERIGSREELQTFPCKVVGFVETHLIMSIRISTGKPAPHGLHVLTLPGVYYFDGPIFWTGVNFIQASDDLSKEIWARVHPDMPDERLTQMAMMFPVYTVRSAADQQITVACMGAHVTEWVPPAAPWQPPPLPAAVRTVRKKK